MASITIPKNKLFTFPLFVAIIFCCSSGSSAQDNPVRLFQKALTCFDDKNIYSGCNEEYRLDQSGSINIPPEATEIFCRGPCLTETQLVLNCVDKIFSGFLFYNRATLGDIRGAINVGCTYNRQRGIFNWNNLGGFAQGQFSAAVRPESSLVVYAFLMISGLCCFFIWNVPNG